MHQTMEAGFKNGVISLNERAGIYYAGQEISGALNFKLEHTLTFRAITLQITGAGRVQWIEKETIKYHDMKHYGETMYKGTEEYFNHVQILCGGQGVSQLQPQDYTLTFKFQIPHSAPSSFKGNHGYVCYHIVAYIEFLDPLMPCEEVMREIQVIAPYRLYKSRLSINEPITLIFDEMYSSGCLCEPNPLHITIVLSRSGFCPGDTVPITVKAVNESGVKVLAIIFEISDETLANIQVTRYRSQRPRAEMSPAAVVLAEGRTAPLAAHARRSFSCDLKIPQMMVYDLRNCSLIDVLYYFKATIKLSGFNSNREQVSEIQLGMIPLDKKSVAWDTSFADQLPKSPPPDPSTPTTPGITAFEPGFKVTPVPVMSSFQITKPYPVEIGFRVSNTDLSNTLYGYHAPYNHDGAPGGNLTNNEPPYPLSQPSAPSML
ncbi:arrestin domain-containing protein 2-like [Galleria mellonella]|uniref:Arrestin domain-containing protein 2-like n=1 Tax=Galleria mellonella TaxID=7137 RepID=A0ABM3MLV1_GALME|nr:arrestin domain-containing protein 2-like [Galleria mellonella]